MGRLNPIPTYNHINKDPASIQGFLFLILMIVYQLKQ